MTISTSQVYSPVAIYTLPVLDRAGHEYVGLLELLEPLGRVSTESKGSFLRLRYNAVDAEFAAGKTRARIHGRDFDFAAPFLIENSRGLVPLNSLSAFLPRFLDKPVNFRESGRRLFVGDAGIQISFKMDAGNPARLALSFSAPVNPTISTEPGKLRMQFKRDPVVSPGSQSISFDNKVITHATYSENNGDAELDLAANQPLTASFSLDRPNDLCNPSCANAGYSGTGGTAASRPGLASRKRECGDCECPSRAGHSRSRARWRRTGCGLDRDIGRERRHLGICAAAAA